MTPSELRRVDAVLDRQIAAIGARKGATTSRRREVLAKKSLAREPTFAEHRARALAAGPQERSRDEVAAYAARARVDHEARMKLGKAVGIADHGDQLRRARKDAAIDKMVDDVLGKGGWRESPEAARARSDTITWYAQQLGLPRQRVIETAELLREARSRSRNCTTGEPVPNVDIAWNPVPEGTRLNQFGGVLDDHAVAKSGGRVAELQVTPQDPSELGQVEDIRRAQTQRPFMPHWLGG
jgi:hypothetical protein